MLESMRNQAQSWIAKAILGGIALSFVLWGIGDYFLGSRVSFIAEVDGTPISDVEFQQAYERQLNAYRASFGGRLPKALIDKLQIKENSLQTLINRHLMLDEARRLGLTAPETALLASLQANPAFRNANGFDPERYRIITYNMGFRTTRDFEDEQRLNLIVDALQKAIMDSAQVSDAEIRDYFDREFEKRVLAAIIVDPETLLPGITVNDEQARNYYEANRESYRSPLRVKLDAVEIDPADFKADLVVEDKEIRSLFESRQAEFSGTTFEAVRDRLAEELRNTKAGDEAYKLSQDLDNALGMEGSLRSAAASLNLKLREIGPISDDEALGNKLLASDPSLRAKAFSAMPGDPVEIIDLNDGRFVALEVTKRIEPEILPFADVAARVYSDARRDMAQQKAHELALKIINSSGQSVDALAQHFGQPKYISKPVRGNGIGDDASWLTQGVLEQAFRTPAGAWLAEPVKVSQGLAVIHVEKVITPSEAEYADQKEKMRREVEQAKGAVRFVRWMASVRDRHDIVVHQDILERY